MNKILSGFAGLLMLLVAVSASAYALFSSDVAITGMVLGAQTPGLSISMESESSGFTSTIPLNGQGFDKLFPGDHDHGTFWLRNTTNSGNVGDPWDALDFDLTGKLDSAVGDWNELKYALEIRVFLTSDETKTSGWKNLAYWNSNSVNLPGDPLTTGDTEKYTIEYRLRETYAEGPLTGQPVGNEVAGKEVSDISFSITGTQSN